MFPLIENLESHFGKIKNGWNADEWADPSIQVVEFRDGKVPGVTVFSTLGLSSFPLQSTVSAKQIRQELFIMVKDGQVHPRIPAVLDLVARERVRTDTPILRGEVIHKQDRLLEGRSFVALFATLLIYYDHDFWTFHDDERGDVVFSWLLPIRDGESSYISQNGWADFEAFIDKARFDLFDLDRPNLI